MSVVRDATMRVNLTDGVQALALTVIQHAVNDACRPRPPAEALEFLTDTHGAWAQSFEAWCEVASINPDWARERIQRTLLQATRVAEAKPRVLGGFCRKSGTRSLPDQKTGYTGFKTAGNSMSDCRKNENGEK